MEACIISTQSSMKTQEPTSQEIEELVAFMPQLYAEGFTPIKQWQGGTDGPEGTSSFHMAEYNELVKEFFRLAASPCWQDRDYLSKKAGHMLRDQNLIKKASLDQIKTMLTFCVREERFCEGHWAAVIKAGYIRQILERLAILALEST